MKQRNEPSHRPQPSDPGPAIVRCPIHGIAYDAEKEVCPECAKAKPKPPSVALQSVPGRAGAGRSTGKPATGARKRRRHAS